MKFLILSLFLALTGPGAEASRSIQDKLKGHLDGQGDLVRYNIKRLGDKTIELEVYVSSELDLEAAKPILEDFSNYRNWALKNLNIKPSGKEYRFRITDFIPRGTSPEKIGLQYGIKIPIFSTKSEQVFTVKASSTENTFKLEAVTADQTDRIIEKANAHAIFFPQSQGRNRVWIYIFGSLTLKSWLLYQALPEKMIRRFVADRVEIVMDNLREAQDKSLLMPKPHAKANP